jgi:AcrR family transcriptional regulator
VGPERALTDGRRPGRPRSEEADRAILDAALDEYAHRGLDGLTMDAVAGRAGVSKATIYRRYPCKMDLVIAAVTMVGDEHSAIPDSGDLRSDLRDILVTLRTKVLDSKLGPCLRMLVVDSYVHDELRDAHRAFVAQRRASTKRMLGHAVERGELREGLDLDLVCDLLVSVLFYRFLVSGRPITDAVLDELVDTILRAYRP